MEEYTKLTGKEINKLKPSDWVAWRKERWKPIGRDTEWAEAQLTERPIRCYEVGFVRFGGIRISIEKNRLHKPPPVVGIDAIYRRMRKTSPDGLNAFHSAFRCTVIAAICS